MSKKLIFPKHVKSILVLVLTCLIAITLTGCDRSNRKSTGDLPLDAEYASNGKHTVTVGELYDELRYHASDYVIDETFNLVYKKELDQVKANPKKYEEKFNELILTEIYGTDDAEEIVEMKEDDAKGVEIKVNQYIDAMYQEGYKLTSEQVEAKDFSSVYSHYYLEVAKYVAAWNKLSEKFEVNADGTINFGEITKESTITESEVVNWYTANYTNQKPVDAVLIRFINSTEASNLLKKFGIKTENGRWYQIKLDEKECATKNGYDEFYDEYDVDKSEYGTISIEELGKGKATILKIFAAMYNYIYPYRTPITGFTNVDLNTIKAGLKDTEQHLLYYHYIEAIIDEDHESTTSEEDMLASLKSKLLAYDKADSNNEYIHMSKDRLDGYSTSLATYLYNTLKTKDEVEEDETYTQFTTSAKSYNSYYYMLFKLGKEEDQKLYDEVKNDDGTTSYNFLDSEEAVALKQTILTEIFESKLDETYIHELEHERIEEVKIKIFDSVVESQFMYLSNSELVEHYDKTRKSNNNYIASVTYQDETINISVNDAYAYLEPLYGPQAAASLLFDKYIVETKYYTDLADDYDQYVETIETMLYYFSNDYYASSGYPSTLGKYTFMKLYFRTAVVEEAVKDTLMLTDAKSAYISDFAAHGFANDTFYSSLLSYANTDRSKYFSLTATALKVSVDKDEDGEADELTGTDLAKANELLVKARNEISNSSESYANALNTVVSNFNSSSRIVENELNPTTPEYKWAEYRALGLNLESVSIGEINNTNETADEAVKARIESLYPTLVNKELGLTSAYLDTEILNTENSLSLLLITAGTLPTSAKYENEENEDLYKNINVIINDKLQKFENLDYSADLITLDQVKIYVSEYVLLGDVYSLPATTTTALDTYLLPLISKYTSSASQMLIIDNAIGTITFKDNTKAVASTFNEAFIKDYSRSSFYENYKAINIKTADSYKEETYAGWWTNMYKGGNN